MSNRRIILGLTLLYVAFASAWVLCSDLLVEWLGGIDLLAMVSIPKGLLFVAITAAAFYLVLNAAVSGRLAGRVVPRWLGVASALLLTALSVGSGVLAAGLVMWRASGPLIAHQVDELRTIAAFQIMALEQNRLRGEANARLLAGRRLFYETVARWHASPDPAERDSLRGQLVDMAKLHGFSRVELLDENAKPVLRLLGTRSSPSDMGVVNEARRTGQMVFVPLHREGQESAYSYGFLLPLPSVPSPGGVPVEPLFLLAEVNAADFIYPYLSHWPIPTRTGQSYLVRPQADGTYLLVSPMRVGHVAPFTRTFPKGAFDFAMASAAPGDVPRGAGSTGATVLAVAEHVGDAPVILVAEIAEDEATAAARDVAIMSGLVLLMAIAGAAAAAAALRQRDKLLAARRELHQAEALRQAEMRFRATFEQAAVGIVHLHLDGAFLRVNRKACDMMGYGRDEFLAMNYRQLRYADPARPDDAIIARLASGEMEQAVDERCYIRKDGRPVWLNTTTTVARTAHGAADAGIPADVLANRPDLQAAEARLRESLTAVDVAKLSFYPTFSLTGSLGSSSLKLAEVLQNPVGTLGAGLALPFVQWNTLDLELKVARVEYEQAVVAFRQDLFTALGEVEKALSGRTRYAAEGGYLEEALLLARESERLAEVRYRSGAISLQDLIATSQTRRLAEAELAANRLNRYKNLMTLCQALGGGSPFVQE